MFIYFVPGMMGRINEVTGWKSRVDGSARKGEITSGPDGGKGTILADKRVPASEFGFYPDCQQWERDGDLWVGMRTDAPITPEHLARENQIPGHMVTMNDGNQWQIPAVVKWTSQGMQPNVPQVLTWKDNGWYYNGVVREYEELYQKTVPFFDAWLASLKQLKKPQEQPVEVEVSIGELDEMALFVKGLATNYRVSAIEISMLRLAREDAVSEALFAMIDHPTIIAEMQKKTQHV